MENRGRINFLIGHRRFEEKLLKEVIENEEDRYTRLNSAIRHGRDNWFLIFIGLEVGSLKDRHGGSTNGDSNSAVVWLTMKLALTGIQCH